MNLDANTTALLVMDYQVGLLTRIADADALLDRVAHAVDVVRAVGGHVGWVRVGFTDAEFQAIPPGSVMARAATPNRRDALHLDAPATRIHPRLRPSSGDVIVRKTRVGGFTTTDLDRQLRDRRIGTLLLAGISTSGVVLSTVREAMDRDYRIVVLADACADPVSDVHTFLIERIFPSHASVVDVADLPSRF